MLAVAASIPGAWFLTLIAGFLFGPILGTFVVVFSATMGAFFVYLAVKFALRDWIAQKTTKWLKLMEKGFQDNAFSYLFFLRLVPVFPFWLINIIPALLGVPLRTFIGATFLGIIPGSFVYVLVGNSLGHVFDANQTPNLDILKDPILFLPLVALGLLTLVPILYRRFKSNGKQNKA
ncbi:MAG: VTT domain-containing protein [Gammaproteobacteria bacterium]|nr:VTT domain-containing protein [Gammaproteobacteria bacterium]MCH9762654.1 VTT domain-containing protein [Gammaproteobacteria bacterium]